MPLILTMVHDQSYRLVLNKLLTSQGFVVAVARDGLQGVKKARELQPDLILLDLYLPRMDGLDVIAQLKGCSLTWDIPIIFMSALPEDCSYWLLQETGVEGFIPKPFRTEELIEAVQKNLPRCAGRVSTSIVH